jgi:hypothetical protein
MALDRIPRIAELLELDVKELCVAALAEFHPMFHAALFAPQPSRKEVAA